MRKSGQLDSNGTLQVDIVTSYLPTEEDIDLDACLVITEQDKCERALQIQKCVAKSLKKQVQNVQDVYIHI